MTIASEVNEVVYAGDGATTVFSFPMRADASYIHATLKHADGSETPQAGTVAMSAEGTSLWPPGGTFTVGVAPAIGQSLRIYRALPSTQTAEFRTQGVWQPEEVEKAFDRAAMRDQMLLAAVADPEGVMTRAYLVPDGEIAGTLPSAADRVNKSWWFDGVGNALLKTATQATAMLDVFTSALKGLVPASGGGTTTFLRADGAWAAAGDVTGNGASVDNDVTRYDGTSGKTIQPSSWTLTDGGVLQPKINDGGTLGGASNRISDAFFATGAVLDIGAGTESVTVTHVPSSGGITNRGALTITYGTPSVNLGTIKVNKDKYFPVYIDNQLTSEDFTAPRALMAVNSALAGVGGFTIGIQGLAQNGGAWSDGGLSQHGVQGVVGEGVGTKLHSRVWGGNFAARSTTASVDDIIGVEIDVGAADAAPLRRYGMTIASVSGDQQGTELDIALRFTNKTTGRSWLHGILFDKPVGGQQPVDTGGYIMRAKDGWTCAIGIDFTNITITTSAFASNGYDVDGSGRITSTGFTNASAAASGKLGQVSETELASGSAVSLSNGATVNVVTHSLPAGDWDVWFNTIANVSGGTLTFISSGLSTVSATAPTLPNKGGWSANGASTTSGHVLPGQRYYNVSATTNIYLVCFANFSGTATAYGSVVARRRR